jgi:D-alanyl-D-alanine carboxypeptidase/D-alanyl-D-alanine-endopeptidase (penicillin-binding protein 4)
VRKALLAGAAVLVLGAGAGTAVVLTRPSAQVTPGSTPTPGSSPYPTRTPLLSAGGDAPVPTQAGLQQALAGALRAKGLGARVSLSVRDAVTGRELLDVLGTRAVTPASTAKLATAVALLSVRDQDDVLTTRVVAGARGDVVLVGAGDPRLAPEDLARLAAQLRTAGTAVTRVVVDDTLFTGPVLGPAWKPSYVQHGDVAPVHALELDGGRQSARDGSPRAADPALLAGRRLAQLVGARVVVRGTAPRGARELAHVDSPPLGTLVETMLTRSDNDLAEALGRQVALATRQPASFAGEAAAVAAVLDRLGVQVALRDASGLSPQDRVSPDALTALLAAAVKDPRLGPVLTGLPVGGFDGTLADRFRTGPGGGLVRAKTGTLDGVSALAGLVRTREGRLLAFDVTADGVRLGANVPAQRALDAVAVVLASCGCR